MRGGEKENVRISPKYQWSSRDPPKKMLLFIGNALHEIHKSSWSEDFHFKCLKIYKQKYFRETQFHFIIKNKKMNFRPCLVMVFGFSIFILNFQSLDPRVLFPSFWTLLIFWPQSSVIFLGHQYALSCIIYMGLEITISLCYETHTSRSRGWADTLIKSSQPLYLLERDH